MQQTGRELIMNVQDLLATAINAKLRNSVEHAVHKESSKIVMLELDGVKLDSSVEGMTKLGEAMWTLNESNKHKQGEFMELHKVFIIGRQAVAREKLPCSLFTFSNVWKLNIYRATYRGVDTV